MKRLFIILFLIIISSIVYSQENYNDEDYDWSFYHFMKVNSEVDFLPEEFGNNHEGIIVNSKINQIGTNEDGCFILEFSEMNCNLDEHKRYITKILPKNGIFPVYLRILNGNWISKDDSLVYIPLFEKRIVKITVDDNNLIRVYLGTQKTKTTIVQSKEESSNELDSTYKDKEEKLTLIKGALEIPFYYGFNIFNNDKSNFCLGVSVTYNCFNNIYIGADFNICNKASEGNTYFNTFALIGINTSFSDNIILFGDLECGYVFKNFGIGYSIGAKYVKDFYGCFVQYSILYTRDTLFVDSPKAGFIYKIN